MKPEKKKNIDTKPGGLFIPNFEQKIRGSKGVVKKPKGKLAQASKVRPFFLPPLNTNINLSKLKKERISKKKLAKALVLPENYNLKDFFPIVVCGDRNDPSTSQFQQYACGCCWAYAIATAISDIFVVQNKFLTNPNLSWTYILSCYPNINNPGEGLFPLSALCGGGDVPNALLWLQQTGIPSAMCVDYAWCMNDPNCTGTGTDTKEMDKAIPSCGCYNSGNFYKYKIKDVKRMGLDDTNDQNPEQIMLAHSQIKQHLFITGTMVGCFIVLENIVAVNPSSMKTGDFKTSKNPEGVYLECVGVDEELKSETPPDENDLDACVYKYENGAATKPDKPGDQLGVLGAHAVSMVGWGMAPVHRSLIRPDIERLYPSLKTSEKDPTMVMVPYWWIRNSWGVSYAENGFFKMAAYPFNRISCVDRSIKVTTDGRTISAGGCILFSPDQAIRDIFPENDQKGRTPATTDGSGGGGGDKNAVETGHFEGANKSAELGKTIPYTQLSYKAEDDVLPQIGTYQVSTIPTAPQDASQSIVPNTFPPDDGATETPATSGKTSMIKIIMIVGVLMIILFCGFYVLCKYIPNKCPNFASSYFQPTTPSIVPLVPAIPPPVGLVPRVAVVPSQVVVPPPPIVIRKQPSVAPPPPIVVRKQPSVAPPPPIVVRKQPSVAPPPHIVIRKQPSVVPPPHIVIRKQPSVVPKPQNK